jgi:hypothetical protein
MSLQPKINILSQDTDGYGSITLQDATGAYNASTNPGGYGAPNPTTGDVTKVLVREEYLGDSSPGGWEEVTKAEMLGAGTIWTHAFREGVTKIGYLVGVDIIGGGITALKGNLVFTLTNAATKLAGATHIEVAGKVYQLNVAKLTSSGGEVTTAFDADNVSVAGNMFFEGYVYSLWNAQGYAALIQEIGNVGCTSLQCGAVELETLMTRYRFYLATGSNFEKGNYSKAHNLAVTLSPELTTTNCATC